MIFLVSIILVYSLASLYILLSWQRVPAFTTSTEATFFTTVTIVVVARNEERNLPALINGLCSQNYPEHLLQIIIVDDCSTDRTFAMANEHSRITALRAVDTGKGLHKKRAIEQAVTAASGDLIITTDADCSHHPDWVRNFVTAHSRNPDNLLLGPVAFRNVRKPIEHFQQLEFGVIQQITGISAHFGSAFMANGANLAYPRATFLAIGGYAHDTITSGDDISLLQKWKAFGKISYLKSKDSIVFTDACDSFSSLINQRVRWARKSMIISDLNTTISRFIFIYYGILLASVVVALFWPQLFYVPLGILVSKSIADWFMFNSWLRFIGERKSLRYLLQSELLYLPYIFSVVIGVIRGRYTWKERVIRE